MVDFLELASRRQSCRAFAERPVEHEKLLKCAEAARLAPSACNSQPWSLVVVEDPAKAKAVAAATEQLGINKYISSSSASFFVVVEEPSELMPKIACIMDSQTYAKGDLGAFSLSLCLEAESQGLGTCILGLFDRPKIREILGIPPDRSIFMVIAVGYPASDRVRDKQRKPIESFVRFV